MVVVFVWLHPLLTVVMNPWVRGVEERQGQGRQGSIASKS